MGRSTPGEPGWVNGRIGTKTWMTGTLSVGDTLKIGNKDFEVLPLLFVIEID